MEVEPRAYVLFSTFRYMRFNFLMCLSACFLGVDIVTKLLALLVTWQPVPSVASLGQGLVSGYMPICD